MTEPTYDPTKRYFGPQGSQLCKFIPEYPLGLPTLRSAFNKAAFHHDVGYTGEKRSGFFGGILDAIERRKLDKQFKQAMYSGIAYQLSKNLINEEEADRAADYADLAYSAVRLGGWTFFRTSTSMDT